MVDLDIYAHRVVRLLEAESLEQVAEPAIPPSLISQPAVAGRPAPPPPIDHVVWSILDTDWRRAKAVWGPKVH